MKKIVLMSCMIFLCLLHNTVTARADDGVYDTGAGITFEGEMPAEEKPPEKAASKPSGGKTSLPQTGQESSMFLPAAGGILLILMCGQILVRSEKTV